LPSGPQAGAHGVFRLEEAFVHLRAGELDTTVDGASHRMDTFPDRVPELGEPAVHDRDEVGHALEGLSRRPRTAWLVFVDLNRFKEINDSFGHDEGDRALIRAAGVLRKTFRQADVLARYGGDEFAVLVMGDKEEEREAILARLEKNLKDSNLPESPYQISFSVGLVSYDANHPRTLSELIAEADQKMYSQKRKDR